jgi:hypothetical protein
VGDTAYRADRLRRAWRLVKAGAVQPQGDGVFLVAGNVEEVYEVDLRQDPPCHCRDMEYRGGQIRDFCKHVGAARLACLDPSVLGAIGEYILITEQDAIK